MAQLHLKFVVIIAIFAGFVHKSSSSFNLGTCDLQCNDQHVGSGSTSPDAQVLRGSPGKRGASGPPGPMGQKGDTGAPCDCLNEGIGYTIK